MFTPPKKTTGARNEEDNFFAEAGLFGKDDPFGDQPFFLNPGLLSPDPFLLHGQHQGIPVVNHALQLDAAVLRDSSQPAQDNDDDEEDDEQDVHRNNHQARAQPDPNMNNSSLFDVVKNGKLRPVEMYLVAHPEEINCLNQDGETVLHLSATFQKKDIFLYLIGQGADPMIGNRRELLPIRKDYPQFLYKVFRKIKLETIRAKFTEYYFESLISAIFSLRDVNKKDVEMLIKYAPKNKAQIDQMISCPRSCNPKKHTLLIHLCSQATYRDAWVLELIDWVLQNSWAESINKRTPEGKTARDYALQNRNQAIVDKIDQRLREINPPVNPPNPVEPVAQPVVSAPPPPAPAPVSNPVMANPTQEAMTLVSRYNKLVEQYNPVLNQVVQEFEGLEKWRAWMIQLLNTQVERLESMRALTDEMNRDPSSLLDELSKVKEKIRLVEKLGVAEPVAYSAAVLPSRTGIKRTSDHMLQQDTPDKSPTASNAVL